MLRFDNGEPASRGGECPKRSEITEFSQKSRQRLRLSLAKVDQSKCGRPIFSGLTYPADFPLDQRTFKRHLKMFSQRFLRGFPKAGFHWKLEFQARGRGTFSSNLLEPLLYLMGVCESRLTRYGSNFSVIFSGIIPSNPLSRLGKVR